MRQVKEVGVHRELGIGIIPLADKVNELVEVTNLLLDAVRSLYPASTPEDKWKWDRSLSEVQQEERDLLKKLREEGGEEK